MQGHTPCHLDQYPAQSLKYETQDQTVSFCFNLFIHHERIAQTGSAFDRPGGYWVTRTSLPVRVYVDERVSERGVPRFSTPSTNTS